MLAISSVGGACGASSVSARSSRPTTSSRSHTSISIYDDVRGHTVPSFDVEWRTHRHRRLAREAADVAPLQDGGVYWQAFGPRFETPAEIRFIAQFADVVGMTMASECIVAGELGLSYAAVCVVDNLANGVAEQPLTREEFEAGKRANEAAVLAALDRVVPVLRDDRGVSGAHACGDATTLGRRPASASAPSTAPITEVGPGVAPAAG